MTFSQEISSSSATTIGMEVLTFCPPSGFGEMIVTCPSGAIFKNALMVNHSSGSSAASTEEDVQDASQLKLIIMPPPARALPFRKERLPNFVFTRVILYAFD